MKTLLEFLNEQFEIKKRTMYFTLTEIGYMYGHEAVSYLSDVLEKYDAYIKDVEENTYRR